MIKSDLSFVFHVQVDTPSHLAYRSDGHGGSGISAKNVSEVLCGYSVPESISDRVHTMDVPFDQWEHSYAFQDDPAVEDGSTVTLFTYCGWVNAWDSYHLWNALQTYGSIGETMGMMGHHGCLPAYALDAYTESSVSTIYVCVLYSGVPVSAASARRAIKAYRGGVFRPQCQTDADPPSCCTR